MQRCEHAATTATTKQQALLQQQQQRTIYLLARIRRDTEELLYIAESAQETDEVVDVDSDGDCIIRCNEAATIIKSAPTTPRKSGRAKQSNRNAKRSGAKRSSKAVRELEHKLAVQKAKEWAAANYGDA